MEVDKGVQLPNPHLYPDWQSWAHALVFALDLKMTYIVKVIEGNLDIGDGIDGSSGNLRTVFKTGTTPAPAGTEFAVSHNFGVLPIGAIVLERSAAGIIYKGTTTWTVNIAYFQSDTAGMTYSMILLFPQSST